MEGFSEVTVNNRFTKYGISQQATEKKDIDEEFLKNV